VHASTHNPTITDPDRRFFHLFEAAPIGMAICNFDGRILEANSSLASLLGYDRTELPGIDLISFQCGDSQGEESPESQSRPPGSPTTDSSLLAQLMRGERAFFTVEKPCRCSDGSEFWALLKVSLARNSHGTPLFLVALLEDATAHRQMQDRLRQAERIEVIARSAGGIAHDFNNLLTGILSYSDLMLSELDPESRVRHYADEVRRAAEQGAALTQQLLATARKQPVVPRPVSINEIVASTEDLLRHLIGEPITLITALDPSTGLVFFDPSQLRQILLNLVLNARDASPSGGTIRVSTRPGELRADPVNCLPAISLIVEDDGCGMDAETQVRIFEPFFTTKRAGEGTGMGLATVQHIVLEAGGRIEVDSVPDRGTRIEVFLPALAPNRNVPSLAPHTLDTHALDSHLFDVSNRKGDTPC
jgi:PAS domain S-box-containing protein